MIIILLLRKMSAKAAKAVRLANELLGRVKRTFPQLDLAVKSVDDLNALFFVGLYAGICGPFLEDTRSLPHPELADDVALLQSIIDSLSCDVLNVNLMHLDAEAINLRIPDALIDFLEVFDNVWKCLYVEEIQEMKHPMLSFAHDTPAAASTSKAVPERNAAEFGRRGFAKPSEFASPFRGTPKDLSRAQTLAEHIKSKYHGYGKKSVIFSPLTAARRSRTAKPVVVRPASAVSPGAARKSDVVRKMELYLRQLGFSASDIRQLRMANVSNATMLHAAVRTMQKEQLKLSNSLMDKSVKYSLMNEIFCAEDSPRLRKQASINLKRLKVRARNFATDRKQTETALRKFAGALQTQQVAKTLRVDDANEKVREKFFAELNAIQAEAMQEAERNLYDAQTEKHSRILDKIASLEQRENTRQDLIRENIAKQAEHQANLIRAAKADSIRQKKAEKEHLRRLLDENIEKYA